MNYLIYDKVVELCEEKGISQRQLQRDLGLSVSAVSRWKVSAPRPDTLQAVADYFNVTTDYLTGRTKYRNKEHMLQSFDQNLDLKNLLDGNTEIPYDQCIQTEEGIMLIEGIEPPPKYIDPYTRQIAEQIMNNDQLKHIFEAIVNLTPKQIEVIYNMIDALDNKK